MENGVSVRHRWHLVLVLLAVASTWALPVHDQTGQHTFGNWTFASTPTIVVSVGVALCLIVALACCSCGHCQSQGANKPRDYYEHTHKLRQLIHEQRKRRHDDMDTVVERFYALGVRPETAQRVLDNPAEMKRFGLAAEDVATFGGQTKILEAMVNLEQELASRRIRSTGRVSQQSRSPNKIEVGNQQHQPTNQMEVANQQTRSPNKTEVANQQSRSPNKMPVASQKIRPTNKMEVANQQNRSSDRAGQTQAKKVAPNVFTVPQGEGGGLDVTGDFDDYTIYDQGALNEYGVLKAEKERVFEAEAGLQHQADFDDYTIYDEGQLNEYGVLKAAREKRLEQGTDLDKNAEFDDYTIYDEGQLNEYGVIKAAREKKVEQGAGLDHNADFDDYTIYEQGELNEYGIIKEASRKKIDKSTGPGLN